MGKSIKTPPSQIQCCLSKYFCSFKWNFLLSTKFCFLILIFWDCRKQKFSLKNNKVKIFAVEIPRISKFPPLKKSNAVFRALLFLSEIFYFWQNFVFLLWYSGIVTAKLFFLTLIFWDCRQQKFSLKNNKEKIFAVDIPKLSK